MNCAKASIMNLNDYAKSCLFKFMCCSIFFLIFRWRLCFI